MPFLYAALYVFRWGFLVGGVFSLLAALLLVSTDLDKAVSLLVSGGVLVGLAFVGRLILERPR